MKFAKKLLASLLWLATGLCAGGGAMAGNCTYTSGSSGPATYSFNGPTQALKPNLDVAAGTPLWASRWLTGDRQVVTNCPGSAGSAGLVSSYGSAQMNVGGYNVIQSNVPGIGFAILYSPYPAGVLLYPSSPDGPTPNNQANAFQARLVLIRTPGTVPPGRQTVRLGGQTDFIARWNIGNNQLPFALFQLLTPDIVIDNTPAMTCTMTLVPENVELGTVTLQSLASGSKSREIPFAVLVQGCSPSSVSMTLSPQSAVVGAACDGIMANVGTANAIGIAVVRNTGATYAPVCWRQAFTPYDSAGGTTHRYEFTASMTRLQQNATTGTVKGFVMLNATFQ